MKLTVKPTSFLKDIRNAFQNAYPNLDIRFYNSEHGMNQGSHISEEVDMNTTIKQTSKKPFIQETITITTDQKVSEVEEQFLKKLGLNVQVFRKSGQLWLQTSNTDHLTIKDQLNLVAEYKD